MKTRTDTTISTIFILYGLSFIVLFLIVLKFKIDTFLILWTSIWSLLIFLGLWKIENFEISGSRLTKTNFCGLFKSTINLENLNSFDKKVIDTDHFKNPINIIKWFSKDRRYLVFRQITILTSEGNKMTIDERSINKEDFNKLFDKIKTFKPKN